MAKKKKTNSGKTKLIEITRHVTGPPRRSPGQRLTMTDRQIREQGLTDKDFRVIATG